MLMKKDVSSQTESQYNDHQGPRKYSEDLFITRGKNDTLLDIKISL